MTTVEVTAQVSAAREAAARARAGLLADAAWQLPEAELLHACGALTRLRATVEAAYLAAVAEVDRRRAAAPAPEVEGPRGTASGIGSSTESFLRTSSPISPGQARADVEAARALAPDGALREMEPQLAAGEVTRAHVDVATRCLARIPEHLRTSGTDRAAIATYFTTLAPTSHRSELQRAANALLRQIAPDAVDRFDPKAHERRFLDMSTDLTGMLVGHFALDAAAGAALRVAVEACAAPRPTDDEGRDPRTAPQRRADALVELAERGRAVTTPSRGERPRVVVHTTVEQLARTTGAGPARTEAGDDVGPVDLRRLSCDAVLQRVVWDRDGAPLGSELLDLGRTARLADVHQRRALAARDRGCVIPGCGARPAACDAHHVVHWADDGATSLGNLVLLCGSHHSAVHAGTWSVAMAADGIPEVVPPARVDPLRRPRRAQHHELDPVLETLRARARGGEAEPAGLGPDTSADTGHDPPPDPPPDPAGDPPPDPSGDPPPDPSGDPPPDPSDLDGFFTALVDAPRCATGPPRRPRDDGWLPPGWDPGEGCPV